MNRIVLFALVLLLFRCSPESEPTVAPPVQPLIGTWRLILPDSTYEVTLRLIVDSDNPPVDVTPFDANGKSAVNTYSARLFAAADGKASVDQLSSTKIAGSPQVMQFEQTYLTSLQSVVRFQVDPAGRLRLDYGSAQGSGTLVYRRE